MTSTPEPPRELSFPRLITTSISARLLVDIGAQMFNPFLPIFAAGRASLYNYSLLGGYRGFIGLDHYTRILSDPTFWNAMEVTAKYVIFKVPIELALALALAMFLQRETFGAGIVRSAIMAPLVTSIIVVSIIWAMMYHSEQGLIQSMLNAVGLPRTAFLSDERRALPAL